MLWGQASALCCVITSRTRQRVSSTLYHSCDVPVKHQADQAIACWLDRWASVLAWQSLPLLHCACCVDLASAKGRCPACVVGDGDPIVSGRSSYAVQSRSATLRQHSSLWPLQTHQTASRMLRTMQPPRPHQQEGAASEPRSVYPHKV